MDEFEILKHIKEMIADILASPRWESPDQPDPGTIRHIGERVNSPESMRKFREKEDYTLLIDTLSDFEESLNDDWMPYTIIGLELEQARRFLKKLYNEFDNIQEGQWTRAIKRIYQETKNKS
jgi:hypothetical protein